MSYVDLNQSILMRNNHYVSHVHFKTIQYCLTRISSCSMDSDRVYDNNYTSSGVQHSTLNNYPIITLLDPFHDSEKLVFFFFIFARKLDNDALLNTFHIKLFNKTGATCIPISSSLVITS